MKKKMNKIRNHQMVILGLERWVLIREREKDILVVVVVVLEWEEEEEEWMKNNKKLNDNEWTNQWIMKSKSIKWYERSEIMKIWEWMIE